MNHEDPPDTSIVVECDLAEPPEKVWRALTVPDLLAAWLMPNDMRPEVGSRFRFRDEAAAGAGIACEVLAVEPHRLLTLSWRNDGPRVPVSAPALDTRVSFVLTRTATNGTHLRVVHDGFPSLQRPTMRLTMMTRALAGAQPARRRVGRPRTLAARPMARPTMMRWAA
jgi:uncharacterized protein YndB with AHSA1/START domain